MVASVGDDQSAEAPLALRLPNGATWRGRTGEHVEVEFEEAGVAQRGRGILLAVTDRFVQLDMVMGSGRVNRTILNPSIRAMRTLDDAERDQVATSAPTNESDGLRWIVEDDLDLQLIRLSAGIESSVALLEGLRPGGVALLLADVEMIDAASARRLLAAVGAAREREVSLHALGGTMMGGTAAVVLACEVAMLLERSAILATDADWAGGDAERIELAGVASRLSGHERSLFDALLGGGGDLSWSSGGGFEGSASGQRRLARAGTPLRIAANEALRIRLVTQLVPTAWEAVRLVVGGEVAPVQRAVDARRPPSPDAIDAAIAATNEALAQLKLDIAEFNQFFSGRKGVWTAARGLRAVWERSGDMTTHADTVTATSRLQRSMGQSIAVMRSSGRRLQQMIADRDHALLVGHRALMRTADALQAALTRNRAGDYRTASAEILAANPLPRYSR
jgi:hypothetical protein